jgi:hypothetical protein
MAGPHHRDARYVKWAKAIRAVANANRDAVCWRCGLTLAAHDGDQRWHAGHTGERWNWRPWLNITERPPPGNWLAPEAQRCNQSAAAKNRRRHRNPTSRQW